MTDRVRLLTFNVLTMDSASGGERHDVVRRLLPALRPDVVALQEITRRPDFDQAVDLLEPASVDAGGCDRAEPESPLPDSNRRPFLTLSRSGSGRRRSPW
jgi:hypothetical protein